MWHIAPNGTARTLYADGRRLVVRCDKLLGRWQVIPQGDQSKFPFTYETREEAMEAAERLVVYKTRPQR